MRLCIGSNPPAIMSPCTVTILLGISMRAEYEVTPHLGSSVVL